MDGCGRAAGAPYARGVWAHPGQVTEIGERHDRLGGRYPEVACHVEVELRCPAVAQAVIQGNGAGHEAIRVEREDWRPVVLREALHGCRQSTRDTVPADGGMDGERAPAGPAGRKADPLDRSVRVERRERADPVVHLNDEQSPVA